MKRTFPILLSLVIAACAPIHQRGQASWYGPGFAGRTTASGVPFRPWKRTAAHKELPFGTVVRVTRIDNGRSVRVVINDRGPYVDDRIIDLSRRAARRLNMLDVGVSAVEISILGCRKNYGRYGNRCE